MRKCDECNGTGKIQEEVTNHQVIALYWIALATTGIFVVLLTLALTA